MATSSLPELSIPELDFSENEFKQAGLLSEFELETSPSEFFLPRPALPADHTQVSAQLRKKCRQKRII